MKDDKCQITMISTWATELYLDMINRLLDDDTTSENRSTEHREIINEFRAFLSDCKDVLDEATTMKLLESLQHMFCGLDICKDVLTNCDMKLAYKFECPNASMVELMNWFILQSEDTDELKIVHLNPPVSYISQNCPVLHVAASEDGMYLAVAGLHGVILYDIRLQKWRVFGDVTQKQNIQCTGLLWMGKIVVICNYVESSNTYELFKKFETLKAQFGGVFDII